jgi:anthraniloyl-CoA monooxygenase
MPLPGFTFMFRENEHGHWAVHAYQYMPGRSTFVVETTSDTFEHTGLPIDDESATAEYVSRLFKEELGNYRVLTNRSHWRQFPVVHCEHWHFDNVVLIGDSAHTAHFSIGSGTKLALEDAIALALSLEENGYDTSSALAAYEEVRRPRSERIQTAARSSMAWFEAIPEHWKLDPLPFCLSLITRSGQITLEKLKKRDPAFAAQLAAAGYAAST